MRGGSWITSLMACVAIGLALAGSAGAAERCVLAELFTQTA